MLFFQQLFECDVDIDSIVQETLQEMVKDGYFTLQNTNPERYKVVLLLCKFQLVS